jgi:hypothetical protein
VIVVGAGRGLFREIGRVAVTDGQMQMSEAVGLASVAQQIAGPHAYARADGLGDC